MRFFDIFPTPKFLNPNVAGLSISDSCVFFVQFSVHKNGKLVLKKFGKQELPEKSIIGGEIKNSKTIMGILEELKRKNNLRFIKASLPEEKGFIFKTVLPKMKESEVEGALRFKIEENVPISANEAVFDFKILEKTDNNLKVVVSVFPKNTVYEFLEIFKMSGLVPLSFESEAQATANAVIKNSDARPYMLIQAGKNKTGLYIAENQTVQYASSIEVITFSKENGKQEKLAGTQDSDAMPIKYIGEEIKIYGSKEKTEPVKEEIEKLLSYWQSTDKNNQKIKKAFVFGENVDEEILRKISAVSPIEIELANVWTNCLSPEEQVPELNFEESLQYATAIGLAIPSNHLKKQNG